MPISANIGINLEPTSLGKRLKIELLISLILLMFSLILGFCGYKNYYRNNAIYEALSSYHKNDFEKAKYFLDKAYSTETNNLEVKKFYGLLAFISAEFAESERIFKKLAEIPEAQEYLNFGLTSLEYFNTGAKSQRLLNFKPTNNANSKIIYGYSLIAQGKFAGAKSIFDDVLATKENRSDDDIPSIEGCVAAFNGLGVAIIRSKDFESLKTEDFKAAISAFQSSITYKLPYAQPYANLDRVLAMLIYSILQKNEIDANLEEISELLEFIAKTANLNPLEPASGFKYFDKMRKIVDFSTLESHSEHSKRLLNLPASDLWNNRIRYLYPAVAVLLSKIAMLDSEKDYQTFIDLAENYWAVCFMNLPNESSLKYLQLNALLKLYKNYEIAQQNVKMNKQIKRLLLEVTELSFFRKLSESAKQKILSAQNFFNKPE